MAKLFVRPPPTAIAGKPKMPCGVVADVLMVSVLSTKPFEGGVTTPGRKEQAAPAGSGPHDRLTGALKVLPEVTRHVLVRLVPWGTERLDGVHDHAKSGTWIWRNTVVMRVTVGLVPTTWKPRNPPGVVVEVLTVSVLLAVPPGGGCTGVG